MKPYPKKICFHCGNKYGKPRDTASTIHLNKCDVCGETTGVTEPRDFGNPKFPGHEYKEYDIPDFMKDIFNIKQ